MKKILITARPWEIRIAIIQNNQLQNIYFDSIFSHYPTYLLLKKQWFLYRECQSSFLVKSLEIEKHCFMDTGACKTINIEYCSVF